MWYYDNDSLRQFTMIVHTLYYDSTTVVKEIN